MVWLAAHGVSASVPAIFEITSAMADTGLKAHRLCGEYYPEWNESKRLIRRIRISTYVFTRILVIAFLLYLHFW